MNPKIYSDTLMEGDVIEIYDGVTGESYDSYVWQGVRPYFKEYIFSGTATKSPYSSIGLVAIGDESLALQSSVKTFGVKCLNNAEEGFTGPPLNTSIYGPNVLDKNIFNLVGTYNNITQIVPTNPKIFGFYYTGKLKYTKTELLDPSKYKTIPTNKMGINITFAHSMSNNHIAVNGGNLPTSVAQSYIYNSLTEEFTRISIPGYKTVTTYGILFNKPTTKKTCSCNPTEPDELFTIVGGCSSKEVPIKSIYGNLKEHSVVPYGSAFIMQYNMTKKTVDSVRVFKSKVDTFIHFQGISYNSPNVYNVATDTLTIKSEKVAGYVKKIKQVGKTFKEEDNVYIGDNISVNSIANNVICGIYEVSDTFVPYQATFETTCG